MGAYSLFMLLLAGVGLLTVAGTFWTMTSGRILAAALEFAVGSVTLVWCGAVGVTLLLDAVRRGPALVIGDSGFEDYRQHIHLKWDDISEAELRPSRIGIAHLALKTRGGIARRSAPFRIGAHRRPNDQLVIPLQFLTPGPHISALVMAGLIERCGVAVRDKPFWTQG